MNQRPRVTVITPSYEQVRFLVDALESVSRQSGDSAIEHVVVDGGSQDGSVDVLASAPGITWVSEPDAGQSDALNKGLARASGDIIGWLNADDFYLPGAVEKVVEFFDRHPDVDIVYGDCVFVDADGRVLRGKCEHPFNAFLLRFYGCYVPSTSTFFRRRLLDDGRLRFDVDCHYVMDYELFARLTAGGARWGYLPVALAAFRWHDANKSNRDAERVSERHSVQRTLGKRPLPDALYDLLHHTTRLGHLVMKVASGGLSRQMAWSKRRGECLRWFEPPRGV